MTRETKIGLLVGLAFIIVIGILLSDYNRNDTQTASLSLVADNVRAGSATMHNGSNVNEVVLPPTPAAPVKPVPTQKEMHPETIIDIGPGPGTPNIPNVTPPVTPANDPPLLPRTNTNNDAGNAEHHSPDFPITRIPETETYDPSRHAEPTVNHNTAPTTPSPQTVNGAKQYVAISGDTVSKLAGRFLGGNTKTNREAIMAINPTLKQNPNNIIVGKTYMIPAAAAAAPKPAVVVTAPPATPITPDRPVAVAPKPTGPQYFYTVKENDNLWRIAQSQLGDGNAWVAIKDLNQDLLKGKDDVRPNMRLRLPSKPVAAIE